MFNLIVARRNCIKPHIFLSCFIHQKSLENVKPLNEKDSSLTLSYLINTCGLSHQSAIFASSQINIKTTHNPDTVIETLKSYDFTDVQITKLLTKFPRLLLYKRKDNIKAKLDFYLSLGYSRSDLGNFIARNPGVLQPSLENRVKPNVELLRSILKDDQLIIDAVTRSSNLLRINIQSTYLPNIEILESHGVGHANISKLISLNPRVLMQNRVKFAESVQSIKEFGFKPSSLMFVRALSVFSGLSPLLWEKKMEVFKSLGLSQKDVKAAFVKHPQCMSLSEDKIRRGVEFYAKEMKWDPTFVGTRLWLLFYSLKKRVIPRCSVMRVLASKGIVKLYPSVDYKFLMISKSKFLKRYIIDYVEQVPEVLDVYKVPEIVILEDS